MEDGQFRPPGLPKPLNRLILEIRVFRVSRNSRLSAVASIRRAPSPVLWTGHLGDINCNLSSFTFATFKLYLKAHAIRSFVLSPIMLYVCDSSCPRRHRTHHQLTGRLHEGQWLSYGAVHIRSTGKTTQKENNCCVRKLARSWVGGSWWLTVPGSSNSRVIRHHMYSRSSPQQGATSWPRTTASPARYSVSQSLPFSRLFLLPFLVVKYDVCADFWRLASRPQSRQVRALFDAAAEWLCTACTVHRTSAAAVCQADSVQTPRLPRLVTCKRS